MTTTPDDDNTADTAPVVTRSSRARAAIRAAGENPHVRRAGAYALAVGVAVGLEALRRSLSGGTATVPSAPSVPTVPSMPVLPDATSYRVTWKNVDGDGTVQERVFDVLHQGWTWYQQKQKSPNSYGATWEHVRDGYTL